MLITSVENPVYVDNIQKFFAGENNLAISNKIPMIVQKQTHQTSIRKMAELPESGSKDSVVSYELPSTNYEIQS